ncbi:hypothetical protein LZ554_000033 [Drepanopeziza brunnea f. sp. 'monogermtubi']|nr:hypothetical protein LZ554_000033 [Drepanopeziza brunnea f. sp. 'monogermtubi']
MQSSMFKASRHSSPAFTAPLPVVRLKGPAQLSCSTSVSNQSSPSTSSPRLDHAVEPDGDAPEGIFSPEVKKIMRNSMYLTFNAPRVDDYHRALFLTEPRHTSDNSLNVSGTLFHASYDRPSGTPEGTSKIWQLEQKPSRDVSAVKSLVLLYKICTLDPARGPIESQCEEIRSIVSRVPLGRQNREAQLGPLAEGEGNPVLDGYDCVIWTVDAIDALAQAGILSLSKMGFRNAGEFMAAARSQAGPENARSMVGVDFGGLRVVNEPR